MKRPRRPQECRILINLNLTTLEEQVSDLFSEGFEPFEYKSMVVDSENGTIQYSVMLVKYQDYKTREQLCNERICNPRRR